MAVQNYELLANAVVEKAASDYRKALCSYHKSPTSMNKDKVDSLERFFTGDMIKIYTKLDGPTLMRQIKQHVIECNFDIRKINKETRLHKSKLENQTIE